MREMTDSRSEGMDSTIRKYLPLAVIVGLFASFFIFGLDRYLSFTFISENRDMLLQMVSDHYTLAIFLYFAFYVVAVAASLPGGLLLTISGGFLFGWVVAGFVTVVAATIGATILFIIARTSLGTTLRSKAGPWLGKLEAGFQENALNYLLFLRLVPAFPFWLINIAPAFLGVSLGTYVVGTFVGIIPGTFVFAFLGTGLDSIILEQQESYQACVQSGQTGCAYEFEVSSLVTPEIILSLIALSVISLLPIIIKRFKKK
ncbi:TVP38/TMEM64 family protein [Sneathiella limimaris]|uniref:TVP38/TMEM64 family protein n=1 Tax=Sneathiella limimaris TaxID=1964213 RepID=UPI0019D18F77|nr:TVP38/TMEM64 family protein [Sneathiella limimaris]